MKSAQFYDYIVYENGDFENKNGKIITPREHKNRYDIQITIEGKRRNYTVSRLLYWLFIDKFDYSDKNKCVSYKDNNSLNISLDNLYLADRKDLIQGEGHSNRIILTDADVEHIKEAYKGNKLNSNQFTKTSVSLKELADKYGVTKKQIHHIIKGTSRNSEVYKLK